MNIHGSDSNVGLGVHLLNRNDWISKGGREWAERAYLMRWSVKVEKRLGGAGKSVALMKKLFYRMTSYADSLSEIT